MSFDLYYFNNTDMKSTLQTRLATNLKQIRKEKKLTKFELAEKANISEAMVKSIELSISWPSDKTLTNLAEALGIDIIRFFVPIALEEKEQNNLYNEIKSVLTKNFNNFLDEVIQKVKQ